MIEWYWAIITFIVGSAFGIAICGIANANNDAEHKNWWEE